MNLILVLCLFLWFGHWPVRAAGEFLTSTTITYEVKPDGATEVTHGITLTNKLSLVYATGYTLVLQGYTPSNVEAWDNKGPLTFTQEKVDKGTKINLAFNEQALGEGSQLSFSIRYRQGDIATQKGQVWEITIPKQVDAGQVTDYTVRLVVPKSFGKAAFVSPSPLRTEGGQEKLTYVFEKKQVAATRIVAAFGQFQTYDFNLSYHLQNQEKFPVKMEVALPPDTGYQRVSLGDVQPKPEIVRIDEDGNWLAVYYIKGQENIEVKVRGAAQIFATPQDIEKLSDGERQKYLAPSEVWQVADTKIATLAKTLKTPKAIYDYVVGHLSYNYNRVKPETKRLGAAMALEKPDQAICTEFTDLFIALARAAGIPARELEGYAYTTDPQLQPLSLVQDVLHAWPEYWDEEKNQWIQVDPTWGNTTGGVDFFSKLDFNHFVFVVHGSDPSRPYPAGSYKADGRKGRDVDVHFGKYEQSKPVEISAELFPKSAVQIPFLWQEGSLWVTNQGPSAIRDLGVQPLNSSLRLADSSNPSVIPPYGKARVGLWYNFPFLFSWLDVPRVALSFEGQRQEIKLPASQAARAQAMGLVIVLPAFLLVLILLTLALKVIREKLAYKEN